MDGYEYELLASCTIGGVLARKYRSLRTGIVVCLAQVEGPLVNGFFCLATEAHDDDGLPHTLEHLIFMGSEKYPYKGVLDLLANRCLAQGTNAWTDVDHTCYTITTAGSEGFLNLLPIYLDHILYPTLTDAAYITEVHHVNGEGEDAGVVYCEMQARENTSEDLTHYHLVQLMYPGHCGYKSETGGRMLNIRTSTSNEKVRSYHHSYYRPDNLSLIVTGQVEPDQLFKAIQPFEEKILSKGQLSSFDRPWQSPIDPLESTKVEEVPFPTSEEDDGLVRIGWRGPKAKERYAMTAMEVLMEYLTDTPVAPLQRDLVEIEEPYCCDVDVLQLENNVTVFGITLEGVPTEKLVNINIKVKEVLEKLSNGTEEIDVKRMTNILNQRILKVANQVEESPHYFFAFSLIGDFLFGDTPEDFSAYMDQIPHYKKLLNESNSFWRELIDNYLIKSPQITVLGRPSAELAEKLAEDEKNRIEAQRQKLGEEGMKNKKETLEAAIEQNEIPAPQDLISNLPVPGTDSIPFHPMVVLTNYKEGVALQEQVDEFKKFPVNKLNFFLQVNHIHSNFVELTAVLDTCSLPKNLRFYLSLYSELMFESPILRNGEVIPYENVVAELQADTISHGATIGMKGMRFVTGKFPDALVISVKVESDKYELGIQWLRDVLYNIEFSTERMSVVANKMINDVNRMKREGRWVAHLMIRYITQTEDSNCNLANMVTQLKFLTDLQERLKDPENTIIDDMKNIKSIITDPSNFRLFVDVDVNRIPHDSWKLLETFQSLPVDKRPSSLVPIPFQLVRASSNVSGRTLIAGVGGVESNYLVQCVPCIEDFNHPDFPAIMVFMEYVGALEGPMWRQIRGMGLSYHYSLVCRPGTGFLTFILFKSTQLVQAYTVANDIVTGYVSGTNSFEEVQLESAKSCVIYEIIAREKTVSSAAYQAVLSHFRHVAIDYNRSFLQAVSKVTLDDLKRVGQVYFQQLFDPKIMSCAVCCNPNKVDEIKEGLEKFGHSVEIVADVDDLAINLK